MLTLECLNCHTTGAHRPVSALRVSALVGTADAATAEQFPVGAEIHLCDLCADIARTDIGVTFTERESYLRPVATPTARPIDPRTGRPVRPAAWGHAKGQAVTWCQCGLPTDHAPEPGRVRARRLARLVREADRACAIDPSSWAARAALARIWSSSECSPAGAHVPWHLDRVNDQGHLVVKPEHLAPIGTGPTAADWLAACASIVDHAPTARPANVTGATHRTHAGAVAGLAWLAANPYPRSADGTYVVATGETTGARQARRLPCECSTDAAGKRRHSHRCPVGSAARGQRAVRAAHTLRHGPPRRLVTTRPAAPVAVKAWCTGAALARAAAAAATVETAASLTTWAATCDAAARLARTARPTGPAVVNSL